MPLSTLDVDTIIDVLDLAHLYGLQAVESGIKKYLQQNLSVSNVCTILDVARRNNLNQRAEECLNFIDNNGSDIVKHDSFEKLSKESLEELLRRDSFGALEIDIFRAVCKWRDNHPSEDFKTVAALVRLPLLTVQQLVQEQQQEQQQQHLVPVSPEPVPETEPSSSSKDWNAVLCSTRFVCYLFCLGNRQLHPPPSTLPPIQ
ncbi:GL25741 [Drosophila persimilis]|uniref:GL25741 n=1 Tax=Drosophila persimilis TaxID=7234 RepID=B4GK57_DROPE|nr:GL25741 [Drosophila persimilis]